MRGPRAQPAVALMAKAGELLAIHKVNVLVDKLPN